MSGFENIKLVDEKPPEILVKNLMDFFGASREEVLEYLVDGRRKWNEKHKDHMEKMLGKESSQN